MSALRLTEILADAGAPSFTTPVASLRHLVEHGVDRGGIEAAQPHEAAAHDLEGDRRAQEADRRADAGAGRDQHVGDAELLGEARGVQRRAAAEGDQGAALELGAALDGVHARGIGHVLLDDLGDAEGRERGVELERAADMGVDGGAAERWHRA